MGSHFKTKALQSRAVDTGYADSDEEAFRRSRGLVALIFARLLL